MGYAGQPKRHLLTTGWSVFVSAKKLVAGDSVIFIWNENNRLLLGVRRANRPHSVMPTSVLSSDSMHIGLLAAAAHAEATNSRFTVFYNPRASPSEFVIPLSKYAKAVYHTRVSAGMRFRMHFETEESSVRRYMGTITGISDLDPVRWPNSHWRSVKVGWDESAAGERQQRVSLWEIEPLTTFPMYTSPFSMRMKRPWPSVLPSVSGFKDGDMGLISSPITWLPGSGSDRHIQSINFQTIGNAPSPFIQQQIAAPGLGSQQQHYHQVMAAFDEPKGSTNDEIFLDFQSNGPQIPSAQLQNGTGQPYLEQHLQNLGENHMLAGDHSSMWKILIPFFGRHENLDAVSKRVALDPEFHSKASHFGVPNPEELVTLNSGGISNLTALYPQLPEFRGMSSHSDGNLFGASMLSGGEVSTTGNGLGDSSLSMAAYVAPPFPSDISPSSCIDESSFVPSTDDNVDRMNENHPGFVKVHKSGSFGRSLDITKFSSYNELRTELARMFGLDALLEDPQRSGWQLVFVDREDDVLLLGDDPWQILSPLEVQQMGILATPGKTPHRFSGDYTTPRSNLNNGIPSVES
ncbi:hypothetical protein M569_01212 [Genlisea aurea]|uniref:Auxin response factor n=1 Tax=Genlisea aurea TaxID=192259 RepID=S8D2C1_9LAMI|nr:hypothetical protein M569_01212 [Genlisea aurea]